MCCLNFSLVLNSPEEQDGTLDFSVLDSFIGNSFFKIPATFGDGIMTWEFPGSDAISVAVGASL